MMIRIIEWTERRQFGLFFTHFRDNVFAVVYLSQYVSECSRYLNYTRA